MAVSLRSQPFPTDSARYPEAAPAPDLFAVGAMLRRRREALGLDLADIAAALRIKAAYLAALEAGCPERLPGPAYAIGFLRAYANCLELDASEVLRRFKKDWPGFGLKPDLSFPIPGGERSMPAGGMLLVASILAVCAYGAWFYLSTGDGPRPERVGTVPIELLPNRPLEAMAAPPAAPAELPGLSGATEAGSGSTGRSSAVAPTVAAASVPALTAVPDAPRGIVIRATADSWIQIRDARRSVLLARMLKKGEIYRVPDQPGLSMRTGNAGGLEITVDRVPAPSIGRVGMARRNVVLDPQALLAGKGVRD